MNWIPAAAMILIFGLGVWAALKIARAVQRAVDAANKTPAENAKKQSLYHSVWSSFHSMWFVALPAVKYVYHAWHKALPNSFWKFIWTMVLAAMIALGLWMLVQLADWVVNRGTKQTNQPDVALTR